MTVHIEFCSLSSFFDAWGSVWLNGSPIGSTQPGSNPSCADFQSGDFPITIAEGANTVTGQATDAYGTASVSATYTGIVPPPPPPPPPPPNPVISLAPHNSGSRLGSFDVVFAHSTPPYFSLGEARSVTIAYNSSTVKPTPVIFLDVSNQPGYSPTAYSVQVRRASDNTLLKLLNDTQYVYYTPATTTPLRLAVAFDAQANELGTGWHNVTVTVTSLLSSGNLSNTVTTRVLVVDQTGSSFGNGVDIVGLQRVRTMPGSYSVLVTEGDGSAVFFDNNGQCPTCSTFTSPAGESSTLIKLTDPVLGVIYRRKHLDGSIVDFTSNGRMARAFGAFADTTTFIWTDTLLTQIRDPMGKTLTLAHLNGKVLSVTDPAGRVTGYTVDGTGRLTRVTDPDNIATNLGYDGNNLLTSITDRAGAVTNFTYDALRLKDTSYAPAIQTYTGANVRPRTIVRAPERIVWQPERAGTDTTTKKVAVRPDTLYALSIGPVNDTVRTTLDRFGSPTKAIGPYGEATIITRDTLGRALVTTEPNGHITRVSYVVGFTDCGYLVCQMKDSTSGRTITYTYNASARITRISGDVTQRDFVYHTGANGPVGALDSVYGANKAYVYSVHRPDAFGRDTLVLDGGQHFTRMKYDNVWGNLREVGNARDLSRVHYDAVGRVDSAWASAASGAGPYVYQYDAINRRTVVKDPLGQITRLTYGATTLDRVIDPKGQTYKFSYNALGMLVARHDLGDSTKADTLKYDEAGNIRTIRTRRGDVITMTYDLMGRLTSRSGPDFPVDSFKYEPAGRWTVAWNTNQRDSMAFDQAGRLAAARQAMLGGVAYQLSYTYDIRDRLTDRSAPTGGNLTKYRYSATSGALDTLCSASACIAFKRSGELLSDTVIYKPGQSGNWRRLAIRDSTHRVTVDTFNVAGIDTLFGGAAAYDAQSRLRYEFRKAAGARWYTYDASGRLIDACDQILSTVCRTEYGTDWDPWTHTFGTPAYAYDSSGNRIDPSANATIGTGNRVVSFRGYTLGYDANGALISKIGPGGTPSYTYAWDALGRLTELRNGGQLIASYKYDAMGRRIANTAADGTTERYVYSGDQVILDVTGTHALKREYGYHAGSDRLLVIRQVQSPSWTGIVLSDPVVGTVRGIADLSGGTLRKRYVPTAWGQIGTDTGVVTRFRMGSMEYDQPTGLYHMQARYYDPELGRFLSEDPIGIQGGLNLYAYAGNDPINRRDPSGLEECAEMAPPMATAAGDTITLDPIEICAPGNGDPPPPPPPCAYFGSCGGNPPPLPEPGDPNSPIFQPPGGYPQQPADRWTACKGEIGEAAISVAAQVAQVGIVKGALGVITSSAERRTAVYAFKNGMPGVGERFNQRAGSAFLRANAQGFVGAALTGAQVGQTIYDDMPWWYNALKFVPYLGMGMEIGEAIGCLLN
ncbi:MAG TPA: RHS repeat-associated core domain-containing protein [Gemmatimonadales bacterium]|nr:RHS repeat-associated core domain-containing protein [Gemmatimonadales bacterium]